MADRWGSGTAGRCIQMFFALLAPLAGLAGPLVLEESARISRPDPSYDWPIAVAVDGDWLLASGSRSEPSTGLTNNTTWLYHRQSNGNWSLVQQLYQFTFHEDLDEPALELAIQDDVAVIVKENASWIFERHGGTWGPVPSPIHTNGMDLGLNGGTIVVTDRVIRSYTPACVARPPQAATTGSGSPRDIEMTATITTSPCATTTRYR